MTLTAADCLRSTATPRGSSYWAAYNRCGMEHHLRYHERVYRLPVVRDAAPQVGPVAYRVGTIVHAGIRLVEAGVMGAQEAIAAVADAAAINANFSRFDVAEGQRLLEAYWQHWGEENAGWPVGWRVMATEMGLKAAGLEHTGAVDTLLALPDGSVAIVDTKTRGKKLPEDAERVFATNPQFLSLSYMLQETLDLDSPPPLIVNAVVKTKVPGFDRPMVRFSQRQVDEWAMNQDAIETREREESARGLEPRRNYANCAPAIGSRCDYFDFCHSESEEQRSSQFGRGLQPEADAVTE